MVRAGRRPKAEAEQSAGRAGPAVRSRCCHSPRRATNEQRGLPPTGFRHIMA
jgi:hypothetical protein